MGRRGRPTLATRVEASDEAAFRALADFLGTTPSHLLRHLVERAVSVFTANDTRAHSQCANTPSDTENGAEKGVCTSPAGSVTRRNRRSANTLSDAEIEPEKGVCTPETAAESGKVQTVAPSQSYRTAQSQEGELPELLLQRQLFPVDLQGLRESLAGARARRDDLAHRQDPRVLAFLRWFRQQWEAVPAHQGRQYVLAWARDGAIAKRLLAQLQSEDLAARVHAMLASEDTFIARTGRDLPTLERFVARFAMAGGTELQGPGRPKGRRQRSRDEITQALKDPTP